MRLYRVALTAVAAAFFVTNTDGAENVLASAASPSLRTATGTGHPSYIDGKPERSLASETTDALSMTTQTNADASSALQKDSNRGLREEASLARQWFGNDDDSSLDNSSSESSSDDYHPDATYGSYQRNDGDKSYSFENWNRYNRQDNRT